MNVDELGRRRISGLYNPENGGLAAVSYWHCTGGRITSPRAESLTEDPKVGANLPIQSTELSAGTCTHTNAHTNTVHAGRVAEVQQPPNRNGKSVPGKAAETQKCPEKRQGGAEHRPPLEEIKLL